MSRICKLDGRETNCTDNCNACMDEERAYTLYAWHFDGEGGYGVCKKEDFPPKAIRAIERIGDFTTESELRQLIIEDDPEYADVFVNPTVEVLMDGLRGGSENENI